MQEIQWFEITNCVSIFCRADTFKGQTWMTKKKKRSYNRYSLAWWYKKERQTPPKNSNKSHQKTNINGKKKYEEGHRERTFHINIKLREEKRGAAIASKRTVAFLKGIFQKDWHSEKQLVCCRDNKKHELQVCLRIQNNIIFFFYVLTKVKIWT